MYRNDQIVNISVEVGQLDQRTPESTKQGIGLDN
jgi:hypothetical protein